MLKYYDRVCKLLKKIEVNSDLSSDINEVN
jgi:hypothetical protein